MMHTADTDDNQCCPSIAVAELDTQLTCSTERYHLAAGHLDRWGKVAKELDRRVIVCCPHGSDTMPEYFGKGTELKVFYWSTPDSILSEDVREYYPPKTMFGHGIQCDSTMMVPVGVIESAKHVIRSIDGLKGDIIALVDKSNVFMLWDACHTTNATEHRIIDCICQHVVALYKDPSKYENAERGEKVRKAPEEDDKATIEVLASGPGRTVSNLERAFTSLSDRIASHSTALTEMLITREEYTTQMVAAKEVAKTASTTAVKQLKLLRESKYVKSVYCAGDELKVVVNLDPVADSEGKNRDLGDLVIKWSPSPCFHLAVQAVNGHVGKPGKLSHIPGMPKGALDIKVEGIMRKMLIELKLKEALSLVIATITRGASSSAEKKNTATYPLEGEEPTYLSDFGFVDI